jgi:hypothetical protein
VDHPIRLDRVDLAVRPWRTATLVAAAVAAVELVLLVIVGGALIAKPAPAGTPRKAAAKASAPATAAKRRLQQTVAKSSPAELPRRKVKVVVLNGNGQQGAAASTASRVHGKGYRIGLVANAPSHDYAASMVMYRRGFEGEARRLARDVGIRVVSPLDGMRPKQLHGAHAVLILGA